MNDGISYSSNMCFLECLIINVYVLCVFCFYFLIVLVLRLHIIFVCVFSPPFGWGERFVDFDQPKEAGLPWSVVVILNTCLLWI